MLGKHGFSSGKTFPVSSPHYALSYGRKDHAFAILSSSSPDLSEPEADFGPRVLCLSARELINVHRRHPQKFDYTEFGNACARRADTASSTYGSLNSNFLDASLHVCWIDDTRLKGYMYGDGLFIHKTKQDLRYLYVCGSAHYMTYHVDALKKDDYLNSSPEKRVFDGIATLSKEGWLGQFSDTVKITEPFSPVIIDSEVGAGDSIIFVSDSVNRFLLANGTPVSWHEMMLNFVTYAESPLTFMENISKQNLVVPPFAVSSISVL